MRPLFALTSLILVAALCLSACSDRLPPINDDGGVEADGRPGDTISPDAGPGACKDDAFCGEDEYCQKARCSAEMGICATRPAECDLLHSPVCGCDGAPYGNACAAAARGVNVDYEGECLETTTCISTADCPEEQWCDLGESCGLFLEPGVCKRRPTQCTYESAPVCGCDEQTYHNECEANANGVTVWYEGPCKRSCSANNECDEEMFCNLDFHCGDAIDTTGTCEEIPIGCPKNLAPVCGCDGMSYDNACFAHVRGISVSYEGRCDADRGTCENLRDAYSQAIQAARRCDPFIDVPQCTVMVTDMLPCGCPTVVNSLFLDRDQLEAYEGQWDLLGCDTYSWPCPSCVQPTGAYCDENSEKCVNTNS